MFHQKVNVWLFCVDVFLHAWIPNGFDFIVPGLVDVFFFCLSHLPCLLACLVSCRRLSGLVS